MEAEILNSGISTYKDLRDLRGLNYPEALMNMPICEEKDGYTLPFDLAGSVRSSISNLDTGAKFETKSLRDENGVKVLVLVWRLK